MENQENIQSSHKQQTAMRFKAFLQKNSTKTGINLYDHMVRLLTKVLEDQPENVVDIIEDMSQDIKRSVMLNTQSTLRDIPSPTEVQNLAEQQKTLFVQKGVDDINNQADVGESPLPNLQEIAFYLAQAGIGLGQEEMFRVFLSLKQLLETQSLLTCRFWGKILGIESSYLVAEVQLKDDEEEEEEKSVEAGGDEEEREFDGKKKDVKDEEKEIMEMELPKSTYRAPPEAPKEENHKGCNKFTYFVCKEPGLPWVRLPPVTPTEITTARQIRKFFTGNLDSPVVSYPPFPGNEANYLRAQIARISAATQVSPLGFYHFGEEEGEEEEEEEVSHDNFEENPEFDGIPVSDLVESLSTWVHHVQYILPQGRCVWVNMAEKPEKNFEEDEEDEEEEKEEEPDEPEPEVGPPLLTPLTEDAEINNTPPWITRTSSILIPQYAIAVLHSKLWPGAYAYGIGKRFENVYIGWGLKFTGESYGPPLPPAPQEEYPSGPDISEIHDPSVMEEEAQKAALEEEGGSQGEAEELDDAEDDEDDDG